MTLLLAERLRIAKQELHKTDTEVFMLELQIETEQQLPTYQGQESMLTAKLNRLKTYARVCQRRLDSLERQNA